MPLQLKHWKTQLNILWIGQAILMAMLAMSLPYWPLYLAELQHFSPKELRFWSAAIYVAPFISATFSSPLWGKLGDKYGYKPMVIRATLGLLLTQFFILYTHSAFIIFLIRLLQGVLAGFIVAAQAWAMAITPLNERSATMGKLQSATAIGNLLGPLLGGIIATFSGYHFIFTSSVWMCFIITLAFILLLQNPEIIKKQNIQAIKIKKSLHTFKHYLLSILFVIIIIQLARAMVIPIFALFVTQHLGGNDITIGVLYAATGLMIFLTAHTWGRWFDSVMREGYSLHFIISILLFISAGLQVLHAYADTISSILILRLLWGICLGGLLPILLRLLIDNGSESENGFYLGLGNSATKFGNLLGIILGALIEAHFGYAQSFLVTAFLYGISGVIILFNLVPRPINLFTKEKIT